MIGYFLNQTTEEIDEMILWEDSDVENGENEILYCPPLITEKYVSEAGLADIDYYSIISKFVLRDSFGQETREHLTIIVNNPNSTNTTTTTTLTTGLDAPLPVVVGVASIIGIAVI